MGVDRRHRPSCRAVLRVGAGREHNRNDGAVRLRLRAVRAVRLLGRRGSGPGVLEPVHPHRARPGYALVLGHGHGRRRQHRAGRELRMERHGTGGGGAANPGRAGSYAGTVTARGVVPPRVAPPPAATAAATKATLTPARALLGRSTASFSASVHGLSTATVRLVSATGVVSPETLT